MALTTLTQSATEAKTYTVDFSEWLAASETIDTFTYSVTPVTTTPLTAVITKNAGATGLNVTLSGGENDNVYSLVIKATTNASPIQIKEVCIEVETLTVCSQ